jgi:hypothetical protein
MKPKMRTKCQTVQGKIREEGRLALWEAEVARGTAYSEPWKYKESETKNRKKMQKKEMKENFISSSLGLKSHSSMRTACGRLFRRGAFGGRPGGRTLKD